MATVNRGVTLGVVSDKSLRDQVDDRIASVNDAYRKALLSLEPNIFGWQSGAEKTAEANVKRFRADVDRWAAKGTAAIDNNSTPSYRGGWEGWIEVGNLLISGFRAQAEFDHDTLDAIKTTAREAPSVAVAGVKRAIEQTAVPAAGAIAGYILKPAGIAIGIYVLAKLLMKG